MIYVKQWVEAFGMFYPEPGYEPDYLDEDDEIDEAELIQESDEPELIEEILFDDEF
ncbi:hypothetical protein [Laspinema olomoucense]|uniref:hypothetical protein n=1 Tax=Laspinema olomoucense TaxID=3231600 RepID=UPI0021BB04F8|nr:hypothetical protein [Laspinema sp. D3d]MCT7971155.1 hypothetical protein [Laspinema sp. D3d]